MDKKKAFEQLLELKEIPFPVPSPKALFHKNQCKNCDSRLQYSEEFDAYFCEACNQWKDERCGDPDCPYCIERPERPNYITHGKPYEKNS